TIKSPRRFEDGSVILPPIYSSSALAFGIEHAESDRLRLCNRRFIYRTRCSRFAAIRGISDYKARKLDISMQLSLTLFDPRSRNTIPKAAGVVIDPWQFALGQHI